MRNFIILASAGLALCGCATDNRAESIAIANCNAVGITEKDPQFATCSQSYRLQYLQGRLEMSYRDARRTPPLEAEYRIPHQDTY